MIRRQVSVAVVLGVLALSMAGMFQRVAAADTVSDADPSIQPCLLANGMAYTPFRDGQGPDTGIYPGVGQIVEDVRFLSQITKKLRTYSAVRPIGAVARIAKAEGISIVLGISLGADDDLNEEEIRAAIALANERMVDSIIVGNEVLSFSTVVTKSRLISYLRRVRQSVPTTVRVTTADLAGTWESNLDLGREVDFVVAHFYPFWENHAIEGAAARVIDEYHALQQKLDEMYPLRGLKVVVGETGWPSAGVPLVPDVVPSPDNQRRFFLEFVNAACKSSIPFYYFSAFDEEWKWREGTSGGTGLDGLPSDRTLSGKHIGSSWGVFRSNGTLKSHFDNLLAPPSPTTRDQREILVNGQLRAYYDAGVDSSLQRRDWLSSTDEALRMSYPSGQDWGAVFMTVGQPVDPPRPWKDFSEFGVLSVELRGEHGGERLEVGIKSSIDSDDGGGRKLMLEVGTEYAWQDIPLLRFASSRFVVPDDLTHLYVVCEFVFAGSRAETVYVRNVRYKPSP